MAQIKTKQLFHCKVLDPMNNLRDWTEYIERKFNHTEPVQLLANQWAIVYESYALEAANALYENLSTISGYFGIIVEEPQWVEVPDPRRAEDYNKAIMTNINAK
jgi:hypothetical protein